MVIGVGQVKGAGEGVSARWVESAMWSEGVDGRSECGCGYDERGGVGEGGGDGLGVAMVAGPQWVWEKEVVG